MIGEPPPPCSLPLFLGVSARPPPRHKSHHCPAEPHAAALLPWTPQGTLTLATGAQRRALTLLPKIWLIAALSFRVHSAMTFARISFIYNMKAFRGFLIVGFLASFSLFGSG